MKRITERFTAFLICVALTAFPVSAACHEGSGKDLGTVTEGDSVTPSYETVPETPAEEETPAAQPAVETEQESTPSGETFSFNGKTYVIEKDWGLHYLTGYGPNEDGSRMTRSGHDATANYTVSSTYANLGKVILVRAEKGSSRYDGVYLCEDTGGPAVETGIPTTMSTPVVDIFFDTAEEADNVTAAGWITARIYILKEVK